MKDWLLKLNKLDTYNIENEWNNEAFRFISISFIILQIWANSNQ